MPADGFFAPAFALAPDELIFDSFAGHGGASEGIELATGRRVDFAFNHDRFAIAVHKENHPETDHHIEDVWKLRHDDLVRLAADRPVGLLWASPDCKHFSKAKGGKPVDKKIRGLAWWVHRCVDAVRPRVLILENVEEFKDWGPLIGGRAGKPCPKRKGRTFRRWVRGLERRGYAVEWRELKACDYGAPTSRKRLFIIARRDGHPIVWPSPTHGPARARPWRTAAECIDWSLPCLSIFATKEQARTFGQQYGTGTPKRPLEDATLRRIARGIFKYVIGAQRPFMVPVRHPHDARIYGLDEPMRTVPASDREVALVAPLITKAHSHGWDRNGGPAWPGDALMPTIVGTDSLALAAPILVQTGYGERPTQAPRCLDLHKPLGVVVGCGIKHGVASAFLAKNYSERDSGGWNGGSPASAPLGTVTTSSGAHAVVTSHLTMLRGAIDSGARAGNDLREPAPTLCAAGNHVAETRALLVKYYGTGGPTDIAEPLDTVTTRDRFGLVVVDGVEHLIVDIGFRMLEPRELFRAQGFSKSYVIAPIVDGRPLPKKLQVRGAGNSVCPPLARALVRANLVDAPAADRRAA